MRPAATFIPNKGVFGTMTNKKVILKTPKVVEILGPGAIQILDFGFWI
jgi:hypothetical protein